jgi:hypothetical protein
MMHLDPQPPKAHVDPQLPPPRDRVPTLPYELEEYARWSCLPDEEDDLVFTAGPVLGEMTSRIPHVVRGATDGAQLSTCEMVLLSLVDGVSPVSLLVQLTDGAPEDALVVMCDLYARGLVAFD